MLILQGGLQEGHYWLSGIGLLSSLLVLYSLIKVFMGAFWGDSPARREQQPVKIPRTAYGAAIGLTLIVILMGVGSEWVYSYTSQAGAVLTDPSLYINAVLKE